MDRTRPPWTPAAPWVGGRTQRPPPVTAPDVVTILDERRSSALLLERGAGEGQMDALGKGAAQLAFGTACLSLVSFASAAESWKEIAAHESPLKTRLEWTKDAKAKYFENWSDNFTVRY